jgi:hypothetical protein
MWKRFFLFITLAGLGYAPWNPSVEALPVEPPRSLASIAERLFVLCGSPTRLFEISPIEGKIVQEIPLPAEYETSDDCGLAVNGNEVFLTGAARTVFVLDSQTGEVIRSFPIPTPTSKGDEILPSDLFPVTGLAFVPGEGLLLFASGEGPAQEYLSPDDGSILNSFPSVGRSRAGDAGPLGRLFGWNIEETGIEEIHEISGDRIDFTSGSTVLETAAGGLAYTGRTLFLSGSADELIKVVDPNRKIIVRAFPAPLTPVCGMAGAAVTNATVVFTDPEFLLPLFGSFRSVGGHITHGAIRIAGDFVEPASAGNTIDLVYPGLYGTEPYNATLELEHFPSQSGTFTLFGVGTDDGEIPQDTPIEGALQHSIRVVFDFLEPTASISQPAPGSLLTFFDTLEGRSAFAVIGNATDPPPGLAAVEFVVREAEKGAGFEVVDSIAVENQSQVEVEFEWDPAVDGNYEIALRAIDSFGNVGMSPIHAVTVDRTPPTPTFTSIPTFTPTDTPTPTDTATPTVTPTPTLGDPLATGANILFSSPPLEVFTAVTMAELDGDPEPELVFGTDITNSTETPDDMGAGLNAINLDGSPVAGLWPLLTNADVRSSPAVSDLDLDGLDEIVVGTYGPPQTILILDNDGSLLGTAASTFSVISSPAIGNLDDDPQLEIVVGTSDGTLLALNADGSRLNDSWPVVLPTIAPQFHTRNDVDSSPAIGDIDGDGDPEIVAISDEGIVYAYETNGKPVAGFPFRPNPLTFAMPVEVFSNSASPILADVDGDGGIDVIAALSNARVYALRGDGSHVPGFPIFLSPFDKGFAVAARPGDNILSTPAVGDVDGDGFLELAVAFYGGPEDRSSLFVYDLAGPAIGEKMPWPMFQQDGPRRSIYPGDTDLDVNRDGVVDEIDANRLIETWHRFSTMPKFHPSIDVDQSREIDAVDLLALLEGIGGTPLPTATHTPVTPTATPLPEFSPTATPSPEFSPTPTSTVVLGTGDVQVTLTWDSAADMDLYVMDPDGETIFWGNTESVSGGMLDVDDIGACEGGPGGGPENIFWPPGGAPNGMYAFQVDYFSTCEVAGETVWMVTVRLTGQPDQHFQGTLNPGETSPLEPFTLGAKESASKIPKRLVPEHLPAKDYRR